MYEVSVSPPGTDPKDTQYIGTVKLNSLPPLAAAMRRLGLVERRLYVKGRFTHSGSGGSQEYTTV